jgi:hypothetical protein
MKQTQRIRFDCDRCEDTGSVHSERHDLPCSCARGAIARFVVPGVEGEVLGKEVIKHFISCSPQPIPSDPLNPIHAADLPGRSPEARAS